MATFGLHLVIGWPCHKTSPAEGAASPESMRSNVDFPDPDGPSSAMMVLGSTEKSTGAIT